VTAARARVVPPSAPGTSPDGGVLHVEATPCNPFGAASHAPSRALGWAASDPEDGMSNFISGLTDWISITWLQQLLEILIYFAILGVMSLVPLILWLGWASSSVRGRPRD
jgi:hypothetical protein